MRRIVSIILLIVYSGLLTIPYIPYMVYYTGCIIDNENTCTIGIDNAETIIGDICYLNAIIDRAKSENASESNKAPPPPVMETTGMTYINSESLFSNYNISPVKFNFKGYMISIKETFLEINVPPPKFIS